MNQNYIMLTCAKNEEKYIDKTIEAVLKQNIKPSLWLILDDSSEDKTFKIASHYAKNNSWIIVKKNNISHKYDLGIHYSEICRKGFNLINKLAKKNNMSFDYLCLLDADTVIECNYFSKIFKEFQKDKKLGIASGNITNLVGKKKITPNVSEEQPSGTARVWTKNCFETTSGYISTLSPDTVSNIKAKLRGFTTKRFKNINMYQQRNTASVGGSWKSHIRLGYSSFYIGKPFCHAMLKSFKLTLFPPFYLGIPYFWGYVNSLVLKKPKITDIEILEFNGQLK
jgi:glycosyltransferase involved in cell wall biosynthesis